MKDEQVEEILREASGGPPAECVKVDWRKGDGKVTRPRGYYRIRKSRQKLTKASRTRNRPKRKSRRKKRKR